MNRYTLLLIITAVFLSLPVFAEEYRVAIFDYDIRPANTQTVAKHVEKRLRETSLSFKEIKQFTGEENETKTIEVLKMLESSDYHLIITITSDAMIPAYHSIKKTPWLFTNINKPTFFGVKNPKKPGGNMSGVTYYVPVPEQLDFYKRLLKGNLNSIGIIFDSQSKSRKVEVSGFRLTAFKMGIDFHWELISV